MFDPSKKRSTYSSGGGGGSGGGEFRKSSKRKLSSGLVLSPGNILTLPRVELACRDPNCYYNKYHQHQHGHAPLSPEQQTPQQQHNNNNNNTMMVSTLPLSSRPKPVPLTATPSRHREVIKSTNFRVESEVPGEFYYNSAIMNLSPNNNNGGHNTIFDASTLELPTSSSFSSSKTVDSISPPTNLSHGYGFDYPSSGGGVGGGGLSTLDFTNNGHRQGGVGGGGGVGRSTSLVKESSRHQSHHLASIHRPQNRKRSSSSSSSNNNNNNNNNGNKNNNNSQPQKSYPAFPRHFYETSGGGDGAIGNIFPPRCSFIPVSGSSSRQGSFIGSRSARAAAALANIEPHAGSSRSPSPTLFHDGFASDFSYVPPKLPTYCDYPHPSNVHGSFTMPKDDQQQTAFWNLPHNHSHMPSTLRRDASFISCGGFTLNGQPGYNKKQHKMRRFCSSHKIALVVSTFSLLVTIGLIITLLLMKKKGMMEAM